jgi:hypothetical protein
VERDVLRVRQPLHVVWRVWSAALKGNTVIHLVPRADALSVARRWTWMHRSKRPKCIAASDDVAGLWIAHHVTAGRRRHVIRGQDQHC